MIALEDLPLAQMIYSAYCAQCGRKREVTENNRCAYCGSGSVGSRLTPEIGVLLVEEIRVVRGPDGVLAWEDDGGATLIFEDAE